LLLPEARVPVVALSPPIPRTPRDLLAAPHALAPLRARGRAPARQRRHRSQPAPRAHGDEGRQTTGRAAFDAWIRDRLATGDVESLVDYRVAASYATLAVPTSEHFDPLFFTLGASQAGDRVETVLEGFHHANLSMRAFALRRPGADAQLS
jgi:4,5-DOPA dioxygenase extradiol